MAEEPAAVEAPADEPTPAVEPIPAAEAIIIDDSTPATTNGTAAS
jgi:hypothetical protein